MTRAVFTQVVHRLMAGVGGRRRNATACHQRNCISCRLEKYKYRQIPIQNSRRKITLAKRPTTTLPSWFMTGKLMMVIVMAVMVIIFIYLILI